MTPEQEARADIDRLLTAAGWHVCDYKAADIHAARGVAFREVELVAGHGTADHRLYRDGKAAGVNVAKKQGATRTRTQSQSAQWTQGRLGSFQHGRLKATKQVRRDIPKRTEIHNQAHTVYQCWEIVRFLDRQNFANAQAGTGKRPRRFATIASLTVPVT